jgi:hypothetical protein
MRNRFGPAERSPGVLKCRPRRISAGVGAAAARLTPLPA